MSDYIKREDTIEAIRRERNIRALLAIPSIDIVRCKECKWSAPNREGDYDCKCHIPTFRIKADDFCSYGEREGE